MAFKIEQGCPQCGAALELDETDRVLICPYCEVKSFLFSRDYFRYVLPDNAPNKEMIYAPYLRFKGVVFYCKDMDLGHRIVDITHLGTELKYLPASLGLRPQAMKLKFITPETKGSFLRFSLKAADIIAKAAKLSSGFSESPILHRAFIGETMSIIYLPLYLVGNRIFDGVLNRPIGSSEGGTEHLESMIIKNPGWGMELMSTLCPQCGWKLDGERDSVVLLCRNCNNAWELLEGRLEGINLSVSRGKDDKSLYMPFWKITASVKGADIETFSDFIRITNQPIIVGEERGMQDMNFFSPAFKVRPNIFLNLARQFTISQWEFAGDEGFKDERLYPVTLAKMEAVQALKMILASSAVSRRNIFPNLPRISFEIKQLTLAYAPFFEGQTELMHEDSGLVINRAGLEFGRRM
jgi:DNA-directed RNA polymerase subunit RPC12/RpoP